MDVGRASACQAAGVPRSEETNWLTTSTTMIPRTSAAEALLPRTAVPPGAPGAGTEPDEKATLPPAALAEPLTALDVVVVTAPALTVWLPCSTVVLHAGRRSTKSEMTMRPFMESS